MVTRRISMTSTAAKRATKLGKTFERNLRDVAISLAEHDQVEVASPKHVDLAFGVLASVGLTSIPWYKRPELKMGLGAFCFGLSGWIGDVVNGLGDYFPIFAWLKQFVGLMIGVCLVIGVVFVVWGWFGRRLLPSGAGDGLLDRLRCWPWVACEHRSDRQTRPTGCAVEDHDAIPPPSQG